jgi:hypothetical protein
MLQQGVLLKPFVPSVCGALPDAWRKQFAFPPTKERIRRSSRELPDAAMRGKRFRDLSTPRQQVRIWEKFLVALRSR